MLITPPFAIEIFAVQFNPTIQSQPRNKIAVLTRVEQRASAMLLILKGLIETYL